MKKLMMLVAVAALAGIANAATCNWSGIGVTLQKSTDDATKYTVYLFDAAVTDASTMATKLAKGDTSAVTAATVTTTSGIAAGTTAARWSKIGFGDYTAGDAYTYYTVVFNDTLANASYFLITDELAKTVPSSGSLAMQFGTQAAKSWQSIPEPTSGLLLLVGGALLALKRKRA